jgi:hypothetical protein
VRARWRVQRRRARLIVPDQGLSDMNECCNRAAGGMCLTTISQRQCDARSEEDLR